MPGPVGRSGSCFGDVQKKPMFGIRRREFITLVGGVAAVCSFAAWAQQAANIHKVGFLSPAGPSFYLPAFFDALAELGWVEGKNVVVEQRYAIECRLCFFRK